MTTYGSAEWICTRCGTTNRKLVPPGAQSAEDKCMSCHTKHTIEAAERPVRWSAKVA